MKTPLIIGITPFEKPDLSLVLALEKAGAFPVLHLGRNLELAQEALEQLAATSSAGFGVCFGSADLKGLNLPAQIQLVIAPYGLNISRQKDTKLFYQVHNLEEARNAQAEKADGIIVKGNEGAGLVGYESSYILFQRVIQEIKDVPVYVQGGVGSHTAAALVACGAAGVVLDSQLVLFPECTAPAAIKLVCEKLNGNETKLIGRYRVLARPNSPALPEELSEGTLSTYFNDFDLEKSYLPMGQDIALAIDLAARYGKLDKMVFGLRRPSTVT